MHWRGNLTGQNYSSQSTVISARNLEGVMHQYALPPIPPVSPFETSRQIVSHMSICLSICETFSRFVSLVRWVHCNSPHLITCLIPRTFPCNAHGVRLVALTSLRDTYVCICATVGRVSSLSIQWFGICSLYHCPYCYLYAHACAFIYS